MGAIERGGGGGSVVASSEHVLRLQGATTVSRFQSAVHGIILLGAIFILRRRKMSRKGVERTASRVDRR